MAELLVLRHAKSSWKEPQLDDHERPLNKRGRHAARRMGRLMLEENLVPGLMVSSTAVRARETWRRVRKAAGWTVEERFVPSLYHAAADMTLAYLHQVPADISRVLLIGHNPGLEALVKALSGVDLVLPTAALALLRIEPSWRNLSAANLVRVWRPRELDGQIA